MDPIAFEFETKSRKRSRPSNVSKKSKPQRVTSGFEKASSSAQLSENKQKKKSSVISFKKANIET